MADEQTTSTEGRGLLTDAERAALAGDRSDSYRYKTRSYLKRRIEKVERDAEVLAEHAPDLLDDLRDAVDADDTHAPRERRESVETPSPEPREETVDPTPTTATDDELQSALDELDTTDDRRAAVRGCVEYLREHGEAQKSDFTEEVYPDHAAGYGSEGGWWNKIGKEYLQTVADEYAPVKPPAGEGSHRWRFGQ